MELYPKRINKRLTELVEKPDIFEDESGLYIQNISVDTISDTNGIKLICELRSKGKILKESIFIECEVLDEYGTVITSALVTVFKQSFSGYKLLSYPLVKTNIVNNARKIRFNTLPRK